MYESERKELVEKLRKKGISDIRVLNAVNNVERHIFVPDIMKQHAYADSALPIGYGQTISQPYTVAFMTQSLKLEQGSKILEIGTGSGYQAAILIEMGYKVYTIERQEKIFFQTRKLFDDLGLRAVMKLGDGTLGWDEFAPFDGILVTAGGPKIPLNLTKQLAVNGRLIVPVGDKNSQSLTIIHRTDANTLDVEEIPDFAFVPLIGKNGWKE